MILLVAERDMEADKMLQESDTEQRHWDSMDENILLKIFMALNIVDLIVRVSGVCQSWRRISWEPCLWKIIDMDKIMDSFSEPNNYDFLALDVMQKLESILASSRGNVTTFVCSTYLDLDVSSWVFIAKRTPLLEKLVLPLPESMTVSGFCEAVKRWPALKSLTAAGITQPKLLFKAITENCPDFSELKHMGVIDKGFANSIITYLPKLKVLSLRGSFIYKEVLDLILENLDKLEVFSISHCLIITSPRGVRDWTFFPQLDDQFFERAARLKRLMVCTEQSCAICLDAARHYQGLTKWFNYDEGFWKEDELTGFTS